MKIAARLMLGVVVLCSPLSLANAFAENYFIEIGGDMGEEEAKSEWRKLSGMHKDLLGNLQFTPKTVLKSGRPVTHMQAGPIGNKTQADKLCSKLFARNVGCFVFEGEKASTATSEAAPQPAGIDAINISQQPQPAGNTLPWLVKNNDTPPDENTQAQAADDSAAEPSSEGFLGSLFGGRKSDEEDAPPTAPKANAKPKVDVAEAIRVPLSDKNNAPLPRQSGPVRTTTSRNDTGWLNVDAFATEEKAFALWQDVRAIIPEQAAGLRVRIVEPMTSRNLRVSLNVGPFASNADATRFCREGILKLNKNLRCSFFAGEPTNITNAPVLRYQPSRDYNARRLTFQQRRMGVPQTATASPTNSLIPRNGNRVYWVQVLTARNQLDALRAWKQMQTTHADVLNGLRSRISTSLVNDAGYAIRVGPLPASNDAIGLCRTLQQRRVTCRVFSSL